MKRFFKVKPLVSDNLELRIIQLIMFSAILKMAYALTRPVFLSGPDASGYMPAALDFAEKGLFSPDIFAQPLYPVGYPIFLALIIKVVGVSIWIQAAQVVQIIAFSVAMFCYYRIITHFWNAKLAMITTIVLAFNPAWAVVNSEAMYETFLISFTIFSLYLLTRVERHAGKIQIRQLIISGILIGTCITIHPRISIVFIIILGFYFYRSIRTTIDRLVLVGSCLILPTLACLRNLENYGIFTLSTAFWASQTLNRVLEGCTSISCGLSRIVNDPAGFLSQSFVNLLEFWSPHSGSLERGTWFHGISLFYILERAGFVSISIFLALIFSILVFVFWAVGAKAIHKLNPMVNFMFLFCSVSMMLTDTFVYGENRHRLIALIFMLPAQVTVLQLVAKRIRIPAIQKYLN